MTHLYELDPLPELPLEPPEQDPVFCSICGEEIFDFAGEEVSEYEDSFAHVTCEINQ